MSHPIRCVCLALLLGSALVLAPAADAQLLDGEWIQLKVKAKGFTLDDNGADAKAAYSDTVYLFLTADGNLYDYTITYESAPDVWTTTNPATFTPIGEDADIVADHLMTVLGPDGVELGFRTTFRFTLKLDGQGALKKATLKSDSGHLTAASLDGVHNFFGSVTLKGHTVDPGDLPFPTA